MLQTIKEEFLNELNNQSALAGSYYGVADVARIINLFFDRVVAIEQPARPASIDADIIKAIAEIAKRHAISHAYSCAENYDFTDVDYDTSDYRGELTVTATVNVDSDDLSTSSTFQTSLVEEELRQLLTPNAIVPNNTAQ